MKLQNRHFWGKAVGDNGGGANILGSWVEFPPLVETLPHMIREIQAVIP